MRGGSLPKVSGVPSPSLYPSPLSLQPTSTCDGRTEKPAFVPPLFFPPTSKPPPPHASLTTTAEVEEIGREDDERKKGEGGGNPRRRRHLEKCEHTPNNRKIPPRFPPPKQSADGGRGEKTRARTKVLKSALKEPFLSSLHFTGSGVRFTKGFGWSCFFGCIGGSFVNG